MKQTASPGFDLGRWETAICWSIFSLALILRLLFLWQYAPSPDFHIPFGDSKLHVERALGLLGGAPPPPWNAYGSSPLYPLWLALIFKLAGPNLWIPRLLQSLLGAFHCLLIYSLAKQLHGGRIATGAAAGFMAAACGILVLFDGDLLMISLTLFFLSATLLSLLRARDQASLLWAGLAGAAFGVVLSDRTALLPFAIPAAWYLGNGLTWDFSKGRWNGRAILVFAAGVALVIAPITLHRWFKEGDLILVSSNAGINFYIGNHPGANGAFHIPPDSKLQLGSENFFKSLRQIAEEAEGPGLKPSQVSRFWFRKGLEAWQGRTPEMLALYFNKVKWILNAREISNHLDFEYYRREIAPVLTWCVVGFGLLIPGACLGLIRYFKNRPTAEERLFASAILVIAITLLPFFVVDRYRVPLAPFLIVLAAMGVTEAAMAWSRRDWKILAWAAGLAAAGWWLAHLQPLYMPFSDARLALGNRLVERGHQDPGRRDRDWAAAILQYKQAIEDYRAYRDGYQALANLYFDMGYYSGVVAVLEDWASIEPDIIAHPEYRKLLADALACFRSGGNPVPESAIPQTEYELGLELERQGRLDEAAALYRKIVRRDPYQAYVYWHWAEIERRRGNYPACFRILKQALTHHPDMPMLLQLLEQCHLAAGDRDAAAKVRRRLH